MRLMGEREIHPNYGAGSETKYDGSNRPDELHPRDEERLVLKLDCVILLAISMVFLAQSLGQLCVGYASVFGLIEDLHLSPSEYPWTNSVVFIGQLITDIPAIYLMSRLPLVKVAGLAVGLWGALYMCLAATHNMAGFVSLRLLMGIVQAVIPVSALTITSIWYTQKEHAIRISIWLSMDCLAQILGPLMMYGIGKLVHGDTPPWRVAFLIVGAFNVLFGILFYIAVPSTSAQAWFLTADEKRMLEMRMGRDRDGGDRVNFSTAQLREALCDVRSWFVFYFGVLCMMPAFVVTLASLLIKSLHYDPYQTMLFNAPSGAVQLALVWLTALLCYLLPQRRCFLVMLLTMPPLVGNTLLFSLPLSKTWGMIVSCWLASCLDNLMAITQSLSASNVKGNTKRAVVNTFYHLGAGIASAAAPQLWPPNDAPRFFKGVTTSLVSLGLLVLAVGLYWYLGVTENRRREREKGREGTLEREYTGEDVTDRMDLLFRYSC